MGLHIKRRVNGAVLGVAKNVGISFLLARVKDAANGEYGPVWQKRYQQATELAPVFGFGLFCATVILLGAGYVQESLWIGAAAGIAISAGVVSKAYMTEVPSVVRNSKVFQMLVSWAPTNTIVLGIVWTALEQSVDPRAEAVRPWVLGLSLLCAKLGFTGAALEAKAPKPVETPPPTPIRRLP
jgi:hypothetical protein